MTAAHAHDTDVAWDRGAPLFDGSQPCAQTDPELFFPYKGGSNTAAKRVCAGCQFRQPCLDYALVTTIGGIPLVGIWGGTSARERAGLRDGTVSEKARARAELDERILALLREGLTGAAIADRLGLRGPHAVYDMKRRHGITAPRQTRRSA